MKNQFTTGSIPKAMLAFVGPFLLGIIVQNLYGAVDLIIVGHFATTADVSAVTIGSQVMNMITQLTIGFATGVTVLIGRHYGAKDERALTRTTGSAIILFAGFAAVLTALMLAFHTHIPALMQTPPEALSATRDYLFYCSIGIVFIVGYNVVSGILMGLGDSRTPVLFIATACVINIALDIILVRFANMGARGAAIATMLAQAGSLLFSIIFLRRRGLGYPLARTDVRIEAGVIAKILRTGGPVAVQNVMIGASFLFITAVINRMGLVASAAVGVVEKLIGLLFMPSISFGAAVATISAQNIGAGKPDRAFKSMWCGVWMALIPSVIFVIFCQFGGELLTGLFSSDLEVVAMAAVYLRSYIFDCALVAFLFCINGYLNSAGYSWFTLTHSLLTTFALRVPLSLVFSRIENVTLYTIGWAAPISTVVSLVMCGFFMAHIRRRSPAVREEKLAKDNV